MRPPRGAPAAAVRGLALLSLLLAPRAARAAAAPDAGALLDRLEAAWQARDVDAYLSLWEFAGPEARDAEQAFARGQFDAGESRLGLHRPAAIPADAEQASVDAELFTLDEPRASVSEWLLRLRRGPEGWLLAAREPRSRLDGLMHLSLDAVGYRADGMRLELPDFELRAARGTLFVPPEDVGPTALVFVGEGSVRFSPRPPMEQQQLRQFSGETRLVDGVRAAFIRIHPAELHHVLELARFERDPDAAGRLETARKFFAEQVSRSFVLDTPLPGSPWWILPGLGDALVTFASRRHGTLTFAVNSGEGEDVTLFDRDKRRQICLYASGERGTRWSEDAGRTADVLHHDLKVRFEPDRNGISGEDTLRIRLLAPSFTLRLQLDRALRVLSVVSRQGGSHIFFRVRHQDGLMVSLGPLAGTLGEISLTVRYAGVLEPTSVEQELAEGLQAPPRLGGEPEIAEHEVPIQRTLIYTNSKAWYPQTPDDYATATLRFDVPEGLSAVTGGVRTSERSEAGRTIVEYRLEQPGKYISVAIGRLVEVGSREAGPVRLRGFGIGRTRDAAAESLARAADILAFYASEFGPCPYHVLNIALVEGRTPGGHSPPGMIVLARRPILSRGGLRDDPASVSDAPDFFLAHELAHQWWGQGLSGQNYHERWLSEGAAQYAAALWIRKSRGEGEFRQVLRRMARWALKNSDEGPIALGSRLGHLRADPQIYRAIVYDKGAYVLFMLRSILGEDMFRRGLQRLQEDHRYSKVGTDDVRETLETISGRDLSAYFAAWVFGTKLPTLRVTTRTEPDGGGSRTLVQVRPEQLPGPVPLVIEAGYAGGRATTRVTLPPEGGAFTIETPAKATRIDVNADYGLLASIEKM